MQITGERLIMTTINPATMNYLCRIDAIRSLMAQADYRRVTTIASADRLEPFLTRLFAYRPKLIRLLYRLRAPLVRLLGFRQAPLPGMDEWIPEEFPMLPCGNVWFFTVRHVEKERCWIAGCPRDRHLDADLAVVAQPLSDRCRRFHILTVVRYKHWTGPLYFNLIRLFNRLLVNRMAQAAAGRAVRC